MKRDGQDDYPTLKQLELFLSLVQAEGISSAGARLGMSASSTSHALRALEDMLGTTLVDRHSPGVPLTHTGEQILPHVRDVFTSLRLIKISAQSDAELKSGFLRIGSFGASGTLRALPPLLEGFARRYPGIEVSIVEKPDEQTMLDLLERKVELVVVPLPKPDVETKTLAVDELVAVLAKDHELAALDSVPLKRLMAYPFLLTRAGSKPLIERLLARHDLKPKVAHELLQLTSTLEYVARGRGVSILARLAVPPAYEGVVYRPLAPNATRRIALACLSSQRLSPAARALWTTADAFRVRAE